MPRNTGDERRVPFSTGRRTLLGALAGGVGLSALGAAERHRDDGGQGGSTGGQATTLLAALSGADQDVDTEGKGAFHLRTQGTHARWHLLVSDLQDVTAAHIHEGGPDESGPPVITIVEYEAFGDEDAEDGTRSAEEDEPLILSGSFRQQPGQGPPTGAENETVGNETVGNETVGNDTVGIGTAGNDTVGNETGMDGDGGLFGDENETGMDGDDGGLFGDENETGMDGDDGLFGDGNATGTGVENATNATTAGQTGGNWTVAEAELAGGQGQTEPVDAETLQAVLENPSEYYVNVHTTEHPDGVIRGQLYDAGMVTEAPEEGAENETEPGVADNETEPGMEDDETAVGAPDNETDVGMDNETGVGMDNDTGVNATNDTGGGILDGGDGGNGDDGGDGGIFD